MADKQLAQNGDADFDLFAEGDPLAELARIVGYDNRPAMEQFKELERHREAVRQEPVINLEDELLREFDVYDAPKAVEPVEVHSTPVEEPVEVAVVDAAYQIELPADEPVLGSVEDERQAPEAVAYSVANYRSEPTFESEPLAPEPSFAPEPSEEFPFDGVDLERELELSIGYDDTAQEEPVTEAEEPVAAFEPLVVQAVAAAIARVDAAPGNSNADALLDDVSRYPVPQAADVKPAAVAPDAMRKVNYPFTPTFSRATPVASAGGVLSQRAFATPLPVAAAVSLPVSETIAAPENVSVEPVIVEAAPALKSAVEAEPEFELGDFELDLSDIDLDMDASEFEAMADEPEPVVEMQPQPVSIGHMAPAPSAYVAAVAQPRYQQAEETVSEDDADLPFDPSMIADSDETVVAIHDLNVPQLPPVEQERTVVQQPDYDLDIDAEMAQLFGTPAAVAAAAGAADKVHPAGAKIEEDFDEFERAMEEDFRRSLAQRQNADLDSDRHSVGSGYVANDGYEEENNGSGKRRLTLIAAALAGVAIFGGVGVYAFMGGGASGLTGGEPQVILADKNPVKMVPVEKGGKTVPNQDKAVYDRVAGAQDQAPQQGSLVSSVEEPVDVVQRTLTPENFPLEGAEEDLPGVTPLTADDERLLPDTGAVDTASVKADETPAVAPRKVRTMIVKPDGTLVAREEPVDAGTEVASAGDPAVKAVGTTSLKPVQTGTTPNANDAVVPAQKSPLEEAADVTVNETAPVKPVKAAALADSKPVETAKPAAQQKVVDTFKTAPAAQPAAEQTPVQTASIAPGSYVIQIASLPSEAEAQRSYQSLSGKFGSVIGGKGVDIKKAEIAGKGTYYRVRIPAGSRDEANAMCSRYKSAGGSCLVTR